MSKPAASRFPFLSDPMIAALVIATGLALLVPAAGEARAVATLVSNAGIFLLFLVNGMRIRRSEIARGLANWRYFGPLMLFVFGAMALGGHWLWRAASPAAAEAVTDPVQSPSGWHVMRVDRVDIRRVTDDQVKTLIAKLAKPIAVQYTAIGNIEGAAIMLSKSHGLSDVIHRRQLPVGPVMRQRQRNRAGAGA